VLFAWGGFFCGAGSGGGAKFRRSLKILNFALCKAQAIVRKRYSLFTIHYSLFTIHIP
jgi:hypothetical protein